MYICEPQPKPTMPILIDSSIKRLEKYMSFIDDGLNKGTTTVVPFEFVKDELSLMQHMITELETQLSRYRKLLHNINTTPDES